MSVSSRCIGVGGRLKPDFSSPSLDAIESPPRRGVSTGRPAGLSITIAAASMKRIRSESIAAQVPRVSAASKLTLVLSEVEGRGSSGLVAPFDYAPAALRSGRAKALGENEL